MDTSCFLGGTAQALAASLLVAWLIIGIRLHGTSTKRKTLPEPPGWPLIGHLHLLMGNKPLHRVLASLADHHGLIMKLRMGQKPTVVVSDADIAKECLTTHDRAFAGRPKLAVGRFLGFDYTAFVWASYGPLWQDLRKVCKVELLSTSRLETLSHVRDEETANCIKRLYGVWEAGRKEEGDKVQVGMRAHMVDMVINVIRRMVGGRGSLRLGSKEEVVKFKELVEEVFYVSGLPNLGDVLPLLGWIDLQGSQRTMKKVAKKISAISQLWLDERRQARQAVAVDGEKVTDFLDVMLSLSDDPKIVSLSESTPQRRDMIIKATLLVIVFGATDTSSVTLEWAVAALLSNPEAMRKVKEELNTKIGKERRVEEVDIANLPYLQAVIKETLRLYPPAPILIPHESMEDCMVAGFHMPAGTQLIINAWKIQRDPRWWERPLEFEPERFIGSKVDMKGQHFQFLPFGAGRRACPGTSLALSILHLALARLLHSFDWHLPLGCSSLDMTEGMGLTSPRASPLEALMEPSLPFELLCEN
ncbi:hypothetical protein AMTRI_Chr08g160470 [Amborella trichopoda]